MEHPKSDELLARMRENEKKLQERIAVARLGALYARVFPERQPSFRARALSFASKTAIVAGNSVWS